MIQVDKFNINKFFGSLYLRAAFINVVGIIFITLSSYYKVKIAQIYFALTLMVLLNFWYLFSLALVFNDLIGDKESFSIWQLVKNMRKYVVKNLSKQKILSVALKYECLNFNINFYAFLLTGTLDLIIFGKGRSLVVIIYPYLNSAIIMFVFIFFNSPCSKVFFNKFDPLAKKVTNVKIFTDDESFEIWKSKISFQKKVTLIKIYYRASIRKAMRKANQDDPNR